MLPAFRDPASDARFGLELTIERMDWKMDPATCSLPEQSPPRLASATYVAAMAMLDPP
jgi:hypothetical protein